MTQGFSAFGERVFWLIGGGGYADKAVIDVPHGDAHPANGAWSKPGYREVSYGQ